MISYVQHETNYFAVIGQYYLRKKSQTIETWMSDIRNPYVKVDKFALYVLAHLMSLDVIADLKESWWTTAKNAGSLTHNQLLERCEVHLMYLGKLKFTELPERNLLFENSNVDNINSGLAALKYDPNRKCVIKLVDIGYTLEVTGKPTYRPSNSPEYEPEDNLNEKINIGNIGKFKCGICGLKAIMKKELNPYCAQSHQGISFNVCRKKFRYHSSLI